MQTLIKHMNLCESSWDDDLREDPKPHHTWKGGCDLKIDPVHNKQNKQNLHIWAHNHFGGVICTPLNVCLTDPTLQVPIVFADCMITTKEKAKCTPPPPTNVNNERRPNYPGELKFKFKKNPRPPMELDGLGFRVYIYIYICIYISCGWGMDMYLGKSEVATLALLYVLWNNEARVHSLWPSIA